MRTINGKYRIDKLITNNRSYSMYEATDIIKGNKKVNIYMLNTTHIEKSLLELCIYEFEKLYKGKDSFINILDFDSTINLDDKNKQLEYYYVTEVTKEYKELYEVIEEIDESELISIFVNICTLAQEQCYSYVKVMPFIIESIYITKDLRVKLKDKITAILDCRELGISTHYEMNDEKEDELLNKHVSEEYYAEQLHEILVTMVLHNKGISTYGKRQKEIEENIVIEKDSVYTEVLGGKITELIGELYNNLKNIKDNKILYIINCINKIYSTNYSYKTNKKEVLNFNTPIVGRKQEVLSIINSINKIVNQYEDENTILIHGEIGIGKTRLLNNIKYLIDINYKCKLKCFYVTDYESNIVIGNLLRQIWVNADRSILNKYKKELSTIVPEIYGGQVLDQYSDLCVKNIVNLELMAKIALFLQEYFIENPGVIIFDNIHVYDDFTLGVIQYISTQSKVDKSIPIIISYRDGDCLKNCSFTKLLEKINYRSNLDIHLTHLSANMASVILKNILNVDVISEGLRDTLYKYSMGNPLFIEEGVKYLKDRKVIFIDENDEMWKKVSNHDIYMSTDMEESCRNQLEGLDSEDVNILNELSFFYMPISLEVISEVLNIGKEETLDKINKLIKKGILYKNFNNKDVNYTFYNKFLRNYLYKRIDDNKKYKKHEEISLVLMRFCENNMEAYVEEVIYQLEKINHKELLEYYKKREEMLVSSNNIYEAIKCNLKILQFIHENRKEDELFVDEINANMNLGKLYNKLNEKSTSIEYYIIAKSLCDTEKNIKEYIEILREISFLSIDLGLEKNVDCYLSEMKNAVENANYRLGKIKHLSVLMWKLYNHQDYEKVKELCNYGISLCNEEDTEYKLAFMNSYADCLITQGREKEGLELLKSIVKEYSDPKYNIRLCRVSNSIGVVYSDYIQCGEEALKWFQKAYDMGKQGDDATYSLTALSNLGFVSYSMLDYKNAYEYYNAALNKAMENEVFGYNFYLFTYVGVILYKVGRYSESFKYAKLCNHYIDKDYSNYWQDAGPYCIFMYYLSDLIGDRQEVSRYLCEARQILDESISLIKFEIDLLYNIDNLCYKRDNVSAGNIIEYAEKILYLDSRISIICHCITKLINLGYDKDALELYRYIIKYEEKLNSNLNKFTMDYIGFKLKQNISINILIDDLELYKDVNSPMLKWKVCYEIANSYYCNKNYVYVAWYISECCGLIIEILEDLPSKYVKPFIGEHLNIIKAFELMVKVRQYYGINKGKNKLPIDFNNMDNIVEYLKEIDQENMVNNAFVHELRKQGKSYVNGISNIDDILSELSADTQENLFNICAYINMLTLSVKTTIIVEKDGKFSAIASSDDINEIPEDISLINIARSKGSPVLLRNKMIVGLNGEKFSYDMVNHVRSAMCIQITQSVKSERDTNENTYPHDLLGYIYVESNKRLNNINNTSLKKCITVSKILYMILDKENIKKSASIDNLTNTLMRKHLELFIQDQIEKSYTYGTEFSIIMLDIDKFKEVNDNYGHRMGDKVLSGLCSIINANIRKGDVIGRYGGEEFIIVLPTIGINEAKTIAERIRIKINENKLMGDKRDITVSMGIANYPRHATTYDELIEKSDQALYVAKNSGRNRTMIWNESFGLKITTTNRLSGIFVGNGDQDYKNVSTVMEFIDLINEESSVEEKISTTINRISEITEAEICTLYLIENNKLNKKYSKILDRCRIDDDSEYSSNIVNSAIKSQENMCGIDWNYIKESEEIMNIPDIKSNMVVLLKNKKVVIGAIHLVSSISYKEFNYDELNYINTLSKIMVPMLEEI